jgi:gluconokinase
MGVTGSGKTTIGRALAESLQWQFADADDFHPPANVARMHAGIPLDDADRAPWLAILRAKISDWLQAGIDTVLACSALKQAYRDELMISPDVKLVYLRGSRDLIAQRLSLRHDHYMDPGLSMWMGA